jgi:hypothetical protein
MIHHITFGCEVTINDTPPTQHWFENNRARDFAVSTIRPHLQAAADNRRVRVRNLLRLASMATNSRTTHVELGPDALHEQWRLAVFRAEHCNRHAYQNQQAIVDTLSGRVVIVDQRDPFQPSQLDEWSYRPCLEESIASTRAVRAFWPAVRPAQAGEDCHYVVVDPADCKSLNTESRPPDYLGSRLVPKFRVPSFR